MKFMDIKFKNYEDLTRAAERIVKQAVDVSLDEKYLSPFAISAKLNNKDYEGGKPDDITVLLARVSY